MNWKNSIKINFVMEKGTMDNYCMVCSHKGYLLFRKCVEGYNLKLRYSKLLLKQWFNDSVVNYQDLTQRQQRRIDKYPFIGEKFTLEHKRYAKLYNYVDSEFLKYAKIKVILARTNYIRGESRGYRVVPKTVICELL